MNENAIDKLTKLGTEAAQSAINQYSQWEWISSVFWIILAAILLVAGWECISKRNKWGDGYYTEMCVWIGAGLLFIASITVVVNMPDILYPKAKAIHQLLRDASGSKE